MAGSSSTKKAAKLAQRSSTRSVRFQGGTLFPMVIAAILVVGMVLVVYARESRPSASESPPTVNHHWHMPYAFYLCDPDTGEMSEYQLVGAQEEVSTAGQFIDDEYRKAGVHSHDDGLIHWHAFTSAATGNNADLGVFLDVYGVEIDSDGITFPDEQLEENGGQIPQKEYSEDDTSCGGEDGHVAVQVWNNFTDTSRGPTYSTAMHDIDMNVDGKTVTIAFAPQDADIPQPQSASQSYVSQYGSADVGANENQNQNQDVLPGQIPEDQQPGQTPGSQPGGGQPQGQGNEQTPSTAAGGGAGTESTEPASTG